MHTCNKEKEIQEIRDKTNDTGTRVIAIEKRLFGNGVKGMISKMDELIEYITRLKERDIITGKIETWSRKKLLVYIGLGGTAFFGLLLFIVKLIIENSIKTIIGG